MQQKFAPPCENSSHPPVRARTPVLVLLELVRVRAREITSRGGWTLALALTLLGAGCGGSGARADGGGDDDGAVSYACPPPAPTVCPHPAPRYPDIAPIIEARCWSCHSGSMPDVWPLTDYSHVADWQDLVRDNLLACTMPPEDAGIQMTAGERVAILTWILCGFPE
jgi:hypothetical protein